MASERPTTRIRALLAQAEAWRAQHVAANRGVEALACNIRIRALKDALALVEGV